MNAAKLIRTCSATRVFSGTTSQRAAAARRLDDPVEGRPHVRLGAGEEDVQVAQPSRRATGCGWRTAVRSAGTATAAGAGSTRHERQGRPRCRAGSHQRVRIADS